MALACALALFSSCSDGSSGGGSDDSSEITGAGTLSGRDENGQLIHYTITYNLDGGTNAPDNPTSYTIKDSVTLKAPTKDGCTFGGWYTNSSFENKVTEIAKGSTGEKTLYAKWLVADKFIEVPAVSIEEIETLEPESKVLIKGRNLEIKAFLMSDHEVTQAEWKDVMGNLPEDMADTDGIADNNPVNKVSWYDALVYCNKRSKKEGLTPCYTIKDSKDPDKWGTVPTYSNSTWNAAACDFTANGYRLPTEAEWEWAARGGEKYKYAGSGNIDEVAWYTENTNDTGTREVKTKKANGHGLYDMSGNVFEWCWDWRGSISSDTPAAGASSGDGRVIRGASWHDYAYRCEVAYMSSDYPYDRGYNCDLGFRVVRSSD